MVIISDVVRWCYVKKLSNPLSYAHHLYVKIDHIFYRGDMKVLSCRRDKEGESDHYPLVAVFER